MFIITIYTTKIMVSTILIDGLFDLLEESKNIFESINLPFDDELLHCCNFYFDCGYGEAGETYEAHVSLSNKLTPGPKKETTIVLTCRDDL